jgi:hypothetical protein
MRNGSERWRLQNEIEAQLTVRYDEAVRVLGDND